jgi:hypothetical protein
MTGYRRSIEEVRRYIANNSAWINGCLEWQRNRDKDGYGRIHFDGRYQKVHRVAYQLLVGPIPEGMLVCHRCDNPPCINPNHLWLGTQLDNQRDKWAKGRAPRPPSGVARGEAIGRSVLTEAGVRDIRRRSAAGEAGKALAREFGVSAFAIRSVLSGRTWGWVK